MLAGDTAELRKARGAFFTPAPLCDYVSSWAIRSPDDQVLEPACGEAAFLLAAGLRLRQLQAGLLLSAGRIHGVEVHGDSARSASTAIGGAGINAEITTGDFLDLEPHPRFDAVIGNPPYVRYQEWRGDARTKARAAALRAGVALTNLASSWAAFVVHSSLFLRPGGRLGLVLPAELLTVNYAAPVRSYLMRRFGRVRLVLFEQRVFPGVLEEVVLLLADGKGPTSHCELTQVRNLDELALVDTAPYHWTPVPANAKWTQALIPRSALASFTELLGSPTFSSLVEWGDTTLGMVTGANAYFALSAPRVRELKLRRSDLIAVSPPGSRHLRGLSYTTKAWEEMERDGARVWLFRPSSKPSEAAEMYIEAGEGDSVHTAFKCRVRKPWWRVPYLRPADLLLTYMNADTPRLCANRAGVHHLNSVHGLYVTPELRQLSLDLLPIAALNSLTVLAAEVMGRSYGGGMLKLEPREADTLPVPSPNFLRAQATDLRALRPQLGLALRNGRIEDAITLVDDVLLSRGLGMKRAALKTLVGARQVLARRRSARGEAPRGAR
ncbi:MAG: HsdM family class I SAM-dependent methyltransferase [Candidatus Dormibacteria bacterium]